MGIDNKSTMAFWNVSKLSTFKQEEEWLSHGNVENVRDYILEKKEVIHILSTSWG